MNDENTQTTGLKRNPIDKFYTKPDVVDHCLALFKQKFHVKNTELIIEQSAGNGAFINGIRTIGMNNSCHNTASMTWNPTTLISKHKIIYYLIAKILSITTNVFIL